MQWPQQWSAGDAMLALRGRRWEGARQTRAPMPARAAPIAAARTCSA